MSLMPEKFVESQVDEDSSDNYEIRVSRCDRDRVNMHGINGYDANGVNGDWISWHSNREHGMGAVIHCNRVGVDRVNGDSACELCANGVYGYVTGDGVDGALGQCVNKLQECSGHLVVDDRGGCGFRWCAIEIGGCGI